MSQQGERLKLWLPTAVDAVWPIIELPPRMSEEEWEQMLKVLAHYRLGIVSELKSEQALA